MDCMCRGLIDQTRDNIKTFIKANEKTKTLHNSSQRKEKLCVSLCNFVAKKIGDKMMTAEEMIKLLNLQKHQEGGYFAETYRSKEIITDPHRGPRSYCTAIYYMLTPDTFSEMHRLAADEIFHFYRGDPVEMLHLYPDGSGKRLLLGNDPEKGMQPQVLVPSGVWQGARLLPGWTFGFTLMGTTMAPGFEYPDYQSGSRQELIRLYPGYKELITALTRKP
jgi:predicted cupin superfamily sugar epimerase